MYSPSPSVCSCRCCLYDADVRANRFAGPPYGPADLLDCPKFADIGPSYCHSARERAMWDRFGPEAIAWLRVRVAEGLVEVEQARHSAHCLLTTLTMRAMGSAPGIPDREPYVFDELDAYEVLFDYFGQGGGAVEGWDERLIVEEIRSFAAFLTARGIIEAEHGAVLDADFAVWIPRLLQCFEDERWWYRRDGRRIDNATGRLG
jgi:hypothetical protein